MAMTPDVVRVAADVLARLATEMKTLSEAYLTQHEGDLTANERTEFHRQVVQQYDVALRLARSARDETALRRGWTIVGAANLVFQRTWERPQQTYGQVWTRVLEQRATGFVNQTIPVVAAVERAAVSVATGIGADRKSVV